MLLSLTCVSAEDFNGTDLSLSQKDSADLESVADQSLENSNGLLAAEPSSSAEPKCNLILDNDADIENIYIGDHVTWIVSVINEGPDTAQNVKVYDQLPDGLRYVSHVLSKGVFNPETGTWTIGNLSIDDGEVFLNITTKAFSVGEKINRAKVTSDTYNLNENESYEEEEIDVFEHVVKAQMDIVDKTPVFSLPATGNPIALILLSLFAILVAPRFKS